MKISHPLGEEIWIRRDLPGRGGSFIIRELVVISTFLLPTVSILALTPTVIIIFRTGDPILQLAMAVLAAVFLIAYCLALALFTGSIFRASRFFPAWLYAEQLNPETLTTHRIFKQPTQLQLAESTVQHRSFFKHYTTITLTDKSKKTATLPALTQEEHDRFMAYWNAANPPSATPTPPAAAHQH